MGEERNSKSQVNARGKTMNKLIIGAAICVIVAIMTSGCGLTHHTESELTDQEGNMLKLTIDQITDDGFYVYDKKEKTFTPVMSGATGEIPSKGNTAVFENAIDPDDADYVWVGNSDLNLMKLIPKIDGKRTFLTMVINGDGQMPSEYYITKYKFRGYTLGVSFTFGETGSRLFIDTTNICETSMAKGALKDVSEAQLRVFKFNNKKKLPLDNVDTRLNVILGLEKNMKYQVGFFDGTAYQDIDLVADTAVFEAVSSVELTEPIEPTENNFFYITIPTNMQSGYYYINDAGLFEYEQ